MHILVVEDEPALSSLLRRGLSEQGYAVDAAYTGKEALDQITLQPYDLIILDLLLPEVTGLEVCKQIRVTDRSLPILILTALDSPEDKALGLDLGADDYLVKPFSLIELLARVRALLRRGKRADASILTVETLQLDPKSRSALRGSRMITLTTKEYAVLEYLMSNPGRVIAQTELLEHVWDYNYVGMSNIVETYIRYLRKKIAVGTEPQLIHTLRGSGYVIREA